MRGIWLGTALALLGSAALAQSVPTPPSGLAPGFLNSGALPADSELLPAPPANGSAAEARDLEAAKAAGALRGGARWALAIADARIFAPDATRAFSCAAGTVIGPKTDALLRKTLADFGLSATAIKRRYQRARPFMVNNQPICTPDVERLLRMDGSYPSGHSAIGYGWGLILAELIPDRAAQLVARGRAFGDSRQICNAHWLSDVEEGRVVATVIFARLNADPRFRADLEAARTELQTAIAPTGCDAEAAALREKP